MPSGWDRFSVLFEAAGYMTLTSSWPDDPEPVAEANRHPDVFAHRTVGQLVEHSAAIVVALTRNAAIVGHSFGGLIVQLLPSGSPLLQAAVANLNPWAEAKVDSDDPNRGPLLIVSGETDNDAHICAAICLTCSCASMRTPGLEPGWVAPPAPKAGASTNFATSAN